MNFLSAMPEDALASLVVETWKLFFLVTDRAVLDLGPWLVKASRHSCKEVFFWYVHIDGIKSQAAIGRS